MESACAGDARKNSNRFQEPNNYWEKRIIVDDISMYFDLENGPEVEEDFLTALSLLHSTDDDSTEKLRLMLDASIAKKYGPSKTLAARMSRDSFTSLSEFSRKKSSAIKVPSQKERAETQQLNIDEISRHEAYQTSIKTHASTSTTIITKKIGQKMANILVAIDKTEIPTISIPDEGSSAGDGALCKICNGARLGPLILLECQECQDVYHPLCHQPPVLDLDIYDPRLVWHCAKCVELSDAAAIVSTAAGLEDKKFESHSAPSGSLKNELKLINDKIIGANESNEHLDYFRRNKTRPISDQFHLRNRTGIGRRSTKRQTNATMEQVFAARNGSLKNNQAAPFSSTSSSTIHLRKRVGSKLTMTRASAK